MEAPKPIDFNVVKVGDFSYTLEKLLVNKLDIMVDRVTRKTPKLDTWLSVHGLEGSGKSNSSIAIAYYVKQKTGFPIHLFFRLEPLIKFAQSTEQKIIIWDEPAIDSLSTDQLKTVGRDLLRLAMTIRKKRHFFIINFNKFWKFPEYLVVDRCLGMVHMYSKNEINIGRFLYIKRKNLEPLWNDYSKGKKRNFNKYKSFGGGFPEIMTDNLDNMDITIEDVPHATIKDYENVKDRAINGIGVHAPKLSKKEQQIQTRLDFLRMKIANLPGKSIPEIAKYLGMNQRTVVEWRSAYKKEPDSLEKQVFRVEEEPDIINTMDSEPEIDDDAQESGL